MHLTTIPTEELAKELLSRTLINEEGITPWSIYQILCKTSVIPCTDGVAVRRNAEGAIEALAIRRGTGIFKGRLCSVGGRLMRGEHYEACLRRQFRTDLGCEIEMLVSWRTPTTINQAYPLNDPHNQTPPKDFGPEDRKHTVANYYPVRLIGEPKFGATAHGGQEAMSVEWHTLETLPPEEDFGYGQRASFVACMMQADKLLPA